MATETTTTSTMMADPFAPSTLEEFIGQNHVIAQVRDALAAAKKRRKAGEIWWLDLHTIAVGEPGLGKSVLAQVMAHELGIKWFRLIGGHLSTADIARDWLRRLAHTNEPYLWLVDEADSAKVAAMQELHMPLIENAFIDTDGKRVILPPVIFFFTSNFISGIPLAIQSRCLLQMEFKPYRIEDLTTIAAMSAVRLSYEASDQALDLLARNAQGEPRRVNTLLRLVIQDAVAHDRGKFIDSQQVAEVLNRQLFPLGLTPTQVELLYYLSRQKNMKAGLQTLANALGQSIKDVQRRHERFLIRQNMIVVVPGGRQLTDTGLQYLNQLRAEERADEQTIVAPGV